MKELLTSLGKIKLFLTLYYYFGFLYSIMAYTIIYYLNTLLIELYYNVELIKGEDFLFSVEYQNSPNLIMASITFERLPLDDFKTFFREKILRRIRRMSQSMYFIFSDYYWKTHSIDESLKYVKALKISFDNKSEKEKEKIIKDFMEKEFAKHMELNKPLWRIFYCEKYEEEKSLLIIKFHHVLGDGGSLLTLLSSFSNENIIHKQYNDFEKNKHYRKVNVFDKFLLAVLSPLATLFLYPSKSKYGVEYPLCKNAQSKQLGNNNISKSNDIDINFLKSKIKSFKNRLNFTINDFLIYILNKSIKNYIDESDRASSSKNEKSSDTLYAILGVSYRFELKEYELENKSAGRIIEYDLKSHKIQDNLEDELKELEKINKVNKTLRDKFFTASASIFGSFVCTYLMNSYIMKKFGDYILNNVSYIFSNIRGIETTTDINGKKIFEINGYIPHACIPLSFLAVTYDKKLVITANTDKSFRIDIDHLMNIINKNIKIFLN